MRGYTVVGGGEGNSGVQAGGQLARGAMPRSAFAALSESLASRIGGHEP